jgi:hypothetical protein
MLIIVALANAGTWNVCASTEASASGNAGWTIVESRETDGGDDFQAGTYRAAAAFTQTFQPRREGDLCSADGVGGATQRWSTELIAVEMVPGKSSCNARIWADGYADASASAWVAPARMAAGATTRALTRAEAGNTATIGVDSGGGARFASEWVWQVPGPAADVRGTVTIDASAAYNGGSVDVPGWATLDVWDGEITGWLRQGSAWVEVHESGPMALTFGATTSGRGTTCVQGLVSAASRAAPGEGAAGGSGLKVEIETVRSSAPIDARPADGPEFDPCGC